MATRAKKLATPKKKPARRAAAEPVATRSRATAKATPVPTHRGAKSEASPVPAAKKALGIAGDSFQVVQLSPKHYVVKNDKGATVSPVYPSRALAQQAADDMQERK